MFRKNKNTTALLRALKKSYATVECALTHENPLQLLVATILSAQCTDARVNKVTPALFEKYRSAVDFANASPSELESMIHSTGFYRNKAKSILGMAKRLVENHGGRVPQTMEELLELPGVARKTANVVLGTAYNTAVGVVVDTHVMRLAQRFGLTSKTSPEKIEQDLMKIVPQQDWIWFSHALITHGRRVCYALSPNCPECPVRKECANPANA
jgi:endonuclease-3